MPEQKKYEITDIAHPKYPWLHRIRALRQVNREVMAGDLGGYVQTEENLSQDGTCWIFDQAICCEDAVVTKDGCMCDGTVARDSALVGGDASMFGCARAEGNSSMISGQLRDDARIAGDAIIGEAGGLSPVIGGHSNVYGTVCGWFVIDDTVYPGEKFINPTQDLMVMENGKRDVMVKKRKLEPPEQYRRTKPAKENRER